MGVEGERGQRVRVRYICESCRKVIEEMGLAESGLDSLDLTFLTPEDQEDIIKVDRENNLLLVSSLCDECIDTLIGSESEGEE
ncbi:MAG: anti-sigma-F factor Fin [bacterium]